MQALVLEGVRDLQLRTVPDPVPGSLDLLVSVEACGICGSDVHGYDGSTGRRIPPLTMGHEAAGTVAQVGSAVSRFRIGDRVTFDSTVSCGAFSFCVAGQVNLCESRQVLGVSCGDYRRDGAFAEFVVVPEHIVYTLPSGLSFERAALIEAVSIAVHAAKITDIEPGSTAVVVGAGMIGLLAVQAFRHFGCKQVFAVDLDPARLRLAEQLGATATFLATEANLPSVLQRQAGGQGVDIAVEVVGSQPSINLAIDAVRRGGTVTLIGNLAPRVEIPLQAVVTRQLRLLGSCASAGEYPECIELMSSGTIQVDPLISAAVPLAEAPAWFDLLYGREPGLMKVIVKPGRRNAHA